MITEALALSVVTGAGFYLVFNAFPLKVKMWLLSHPLFTRVACAFGVYTLLGGTLVALFAAGFLDLMIGTILMILQDPAATESVHKLGAYLKDLRQRVVKLIGEAAKGLKVPADETYTHQPLAQA